MSDALHLDFETASTVDLKKVGLHNYARHPDTFIWCMGFAFGDEPAELWLHHEPFPERVTEHLAAGGKMVAFNAPFEITIWNETLRRSFPHLPKLVVEQVECAMARCYAMALPGALANVAPALGIKMEKDAEGHTLMLRMCKPHSYHEGRPVYLPEKTEFTFLGNKYPGSWALLRLGDYCVKDVEVEREITRRTMPLSATEQRLWQVDFKINQRGVLFDPEAVEASIEIKDTVIERLNTEMNQLTEGAVEACSSIGALKDWAADHGVAPESLNKLALGELIDDPDLPPKLKHAFELRREAGRATSVAKLETIKLLAGDDGRVRNLFQYHGAGTGRWAGRAVQPHNFPRDLPKPGEVEDMMALIKQREIDLISLTYGYPLDVISKLLRAFVVAPEGKALIGGDWSGVENRGIAWLAGEEWKLQVFRDIDADPGLPDVYETTYGAVFNKHPGDVTADERQKGKTMELAFQYGGALGALHTFADVYGVVIPDEEGDFAKTAWRDSHPAITQFWWDLDDAAKAAVRHPGTITSAGPHGREVKFRVRGSFLWALLPSGRALCYAYPVIRDDVSEFGPQLTYKTRPSPEDFKRGRIVDDPTNTRSFARVSTYGGKLSENVTQAICRDIMAWTLVQCEDAGLPPVWHVHDEPVCEGRFGAEHLERFTLIMNTPPPWAQGFPLKAETWIARRYQK